MIAKMINGNKEVICNTFRKQIVLELKKMPMNINGTDHMFICDPEKDTLADGGRRLGVNGTKVVCGTGVADSVRVS